MMPPLYPSFPASQVCAHEPKETIKGVFVAAVRCGCEKKEVAHRIGGELPQEIIALVPTSITANA